MSPDALVLGSNLVWLTFSFTVASFFGLTAARRYFREGFTRGVRVMVGVILVAVASGAHRAYWSVWRWLRANGEIEASAWFVDHAHYLLVSVALIALGYTLHLLPLFRLITGERLVLPLLTGGGIAVAVFFLPMLLL